MQRNSKRIRKTENVIRLSKLEGSCYKIVYFERKDAGELFDELARLTRKRTGYLIEVRRVEVDAETVGKELGSLQGK